MEEHLQKDVPDEGTVTEEKKPEVPKRFRESLYSRIKVSLKTMDLIIGILIVLLIVFVAFGILQANI